MKTLIDPTQAQKTVVATCRFCRRPLAARKGESGRGRKKEIHVECGQAESALARAEKLLKLIKFQDAATVKTRRGDRFAAVNHTLRKDIVVITPDSDAEMTLEEIAEALKAL